jgi:hypothetical protein
VDLPGISQNAANLPASPFAFQSSR